MSYAANELSRTVADALSDSRLIARRSGDDCWELALRGDPSLEVAARLEPDWLLLETSCANTSPQDLNTDQLQRLLVHNRQLVGGAKFALVARPALLQVRAECFLDEGRSDVGRWIDRACAGLGQAIGLLHETVAIGAQADPGAAMPAGTVSLTEGLPELEAACQSAAWPMSKRGDGRLLVQLDVTDAFCQATAERRPEGEVCLSVDLPCCLSESGPSRRATSLLLLAACRAVRMARATISPSKDTFGWEARVGPNPTANQFQCALGALSVACQMSVHEAEALQEEPIAKRYLRLQRQG